MADSRGGRSSQVEQAPPDSHQLGQAQNIIGGQNANLGTGAQADAVVSTEPPSEGVKDMIDGAVQKGPKRADPSTGGRVVVAETGDLHDLAARRHSQVL